MIQFSKLRINGFKSFVDRTELEISPGLNGIVGPNGCGKSNLVEALRWVMGETSAKRMRGGGMEDVIFSGTTKRAARNIAEVSLLLDNATRTAPAAYNNSDDIEIIRKIERDRGSNYKINGKNMRARDVQMLFADSVTGANSPAMVSQGKVAEIINAKPLNRRLILEDSAGISGLFARRHEAELKLRAADNNLVRLEDVLGSMEGRLNALKRQARQAGRYRNLSAQIRQLEITVAYLEWEALAERTRNTKRSFEEAESIVADKLATVTQLTKTQVTQSQDLPDLRTEEAKAAATLQAGRIRLQQLEEEAERQALALLETEEQLLQTATDEEHEKDSLKESTDVLERITAEHEAIIAEQGDESGELEAKQEAKEELESKVIALDEQYTTLMQSVAESRARKSALEQQIKQNMERIDVMSERKDRAEGELEDLLAQDSDADVIVKKEAKISELSEKVDKLDEEIKAAQAEHEEAKDFIIVQRSETSEAKSRLSEFRAEISMLDSFFEDHSFEFNPALDQVTADHGFEKALSRALGDALMAAVDEDAPTLWRVRKKKPADMPKLPKGVEALLPHINAPKELELALSQIGVVASDAEGDALVDELAVGQSLVSAEGTYWRWDGFCMKAEAADRNAVHLEQKNKLAELRAKLPEVEAAAVKCDAQLEALLAGQAEREDMIEQMRGILKDAERSTSDEKLALGQIRENRARHDSEVLRLQEAMATALEDRKTLEEVVRWDQDRLGAYNDAAEAEKEQSIEDIRSTLNEARTSHQEAVRVFDRYVQEQNSRKARLHAIADERVNLSNRQIRSRERIKSLEARVISLNERLSDLKTQQKPEGSDGLQGELLDKISILEKARDEKAELLAVCETEIAETTKALREAEAVLSEARETRAGSQATMAGIAEQQEVLSANIAEHFEMAPDALKQHVTMDTENVKLGDLRSQKEKFVRDRDQIGPVNLRAEEEADELEKEVSTMLHERNDLTQAIEELRGGIKKINVEARERLLVAFDHVNAHFQRLFIKLFDGGQAHLALIDSDDPLESGLEIFAQPPGKTLQSLSLLSGGEQTMASIALIFAMFLTNPSPICVLDEIDAPLDDANVDRVCDLLEEISERGETRFIIITHHRLTMARMDRLYGVTMSEKGISQLVSVDLQESFDFLEEAA